MYNVSVGPSKIVAKTRRGISQNLESFQNFSRKPIDLDNGEIMNGPKPVFHTSNKKCNNNKQQEILSPQHEELIRFVSESWSKIFKEYESDGLDESESFSTSNSSSTIMYYEDPEPNVFLQKLPYTTPSVPFSSFTRLRIDYQIVKIMDPSLLELRISNF